MGFKINADKFGFAREPQPDRVSRDYAAELVRKLISEEKNAMEIKADALQAAIDAEAQAREAKDTELQSGLDKKVECDSVFSTISTGNGQLLDYKNVPIVIGAFSGVTFSTEASMSNFRTLYIPCEPSTTYTVSRKATPRSKQFKLYCSEVVPENGTQHNGYALGTTTETDYLTLTTAQNANYLILVFFHAIQDTGLSVDDILPTLKIEKGSAPTDGYEYGTERIVQKVSDRKIFFDRKADDITIFSKYSNTHDFAIRWKKKGYNNLLDIYQLYKIPNTKKSISTGTGGVEPLLTTSTDWIGPYQIKALTNIDGDQTTSFEMTGGNHDYSGGKGTGTPTARTTYVKVYADGYQVAETEQAFCDKLEIVWENRVQAYNTAKADGTGREVLREVHTATFDGVKWEIVGRIIPLEQISIRDYYGLQCTFANNWSVGGYFVGAENNSLLDVSVSNFAGNRTCHEFIAFGENDEMVMGIDNSYDIGDRRFYAGDGTKGMRNASGTYKAYAYLISSKTQGGTQYFTFDENCMLSYKGYYVFRPRTV